MLIEFTVGNFRSIKDPVTLSMVAANLVAKDKTLDEENVIEVDDDLRLLKSAAIYGANASGKSNLANAIKFMRSFVLNSSRETQLKDKIPVERFLLSTETENEPSSFQMVFILNGKKYRYGFEVTTERVIAEWLFFVPASRETKLFERELDEIRVASRFKEGKGIEERTRANALFLSVIAQFNGNISGRILTWFSMVEMNLGINDYGDQMVTSYLFHGMEDKDAIVRFIKDLDLGISDIHSEEEEAPWTSDSDKRVSALKQAYEDIYDVPILSKMPKIRSHHRKYDSEGNIVELELFKLDTHESAGTQRLFSLAFPILNALQTGRVLFIDEMDARLHPLITSKIIGLFNSKRSNPNNAQLIFTTHDTSLLSNKRFRRDQIWFVEKDKFGATHLYSLAEFKVRNDASFEEDYIRGRYGAIPYISSDLRWIVDGNNAEK
ncbi:MAG TPA: ATP-binding protein [Chloroflexia bacterium]|nr:ATP-binding protein [Chloroflexia bacterium]